LYLFEDKKEKEFIVKCKLCFQEITFKISLDEYKATEKFPIKKESIHGEPPHKLIVFFDRNLEIEKFEIEDILEKSTSYSKELTYQVLSNLQLTEDEIELYFSTTGRDVISSGEMSLLIDKPKEECEKIAKKFVDKGLYKEVVGATPHYAPLPPYAALIEQLTNFEKYIQDIKNSAPEELEKSFSQLESSSKGVQELNEYTNFMKNLKNSIEDQIESQKEEIENAIETIKQIRKINEIIGNLEDDTKLLIEEQVIDLESQFEEMEKLIEGNLQKLHLGVIKKTVKQMIENVLTTRLEVIKDDFNKKFLSKISIIIKDIMEGINQVTKSSIKTGENLEKTFSNVIKEFNESVTYAEEKVKGISDDIMESFSALKNTFSVKVVDTLNQELSKILERLDISETTTEEFWEQAKKKTVMSMKDIWFIKSIEGARAHINEEISKAKMRILIVSPTIAEIDVSLLKSLPKHVNIRIAAYIDSSSATHKSIIQELDTMQNVSYRHRELQNLWGINRDYEEVILCILSQTKIGKKEAVEIGGIGSMVQAHMKIFVPVLEEAWIKAQKTVMPSIRSSIARKSTSEFTRAKEFEKTPQNMKTSNHTLNNQIKEQKTPNIGTQSKPSDDIDITPEIETTSQETLEPEKPNEPLIDKINSIKPPVENPAQEISEPEGLIENLTLSESFEVFRNNLNKKKGVELSSELQKIRNKISDKLGYSAVLNPIDLSIASLKNEPSTLNQYEQEDLINKIQFWMKKLNL